MDLQTFFLSFIQSLHFYTYIILHISIIDSFLATFFFFIYSLLKVTICIQFQNKQVDVHLDETV